MDRAFLISFRLVFLVRLRLEYLVRFTLERFCEEVVSMIDVPGPVLVNHCQSVSELFSLTYGFYSYVHFCDPSSRSSFVKEIDGCTFVVASHPVARFLASPC